MYSITRDGIPENLWNKINVLLPPEKPKAGRPNKNHLIIVEGILWVLRTVVPWRDLPEKFGSWYTVYAGRTKEYGNK